MLAKGTFPAECHHLSFKAPGLATPPFPWKLNVWIMLLQLACYFGGLFAFFFFFFTAPALGHY